MSELRRGWRSVTFQSIALDVPRLLASELDNYLEEFVFRFNRRTSASRGMLFYRLPQQAVVTDPVTYKDVVAPVASRSKRA